MVKEILFFSLNDEKGFLIVVRIKMWNILEPILLNLIKRQALIRWRGIIKAWKSDRKESFTNKNLMHLNLDYCKYLESHNNPPFLNKVRKF